MSVDTGISVESDITIYYIRPYYKYIKDLESFKYMGVYDIHVEANTNDVPTNCTRTANGQAVQRLWQSTLRRELYGLP